MYFQAQNSFTHKYFALLVVTMSPATRKTFVVFLQESFGILLYFFANLLSITKEEEDK